MTASQESDAPEPSGASYERRSEASEGVPVQRVPIGKKFAVRLTIGVVAAALCLVAIPQAIWTARLEAPQYKGPRALHITAYGDRLVGDICELNDLNHYIGMKPLGEPEVPCGSVSLGRGKNIVGRIAPEMALWLPSAIVAAGAALVAMLTKRRWLRVLSLVFMWGLPVGVLFMTQVHLHIFGHDLDPAAAFHPKPFTPHVLGPSKIYQFDVDARLGAGMIMVIAAAALVTFGSWLVSKSYTWITGRAAVVLALVLVSVAGVAPSRSFAQGSSDPLGTAAGVRTSLGQTADGDAQRRGADLAARLATARDGDTVAIASGTYRGNFVVPAAVHLVGEGRPVLDGGGAGTVLTLTKTAKGASVKGLRLVGTGPGPTGTPTGLRVESDDAVVEDVEVADSYMGIQVVGANGVHVRGSSIEGFAQGGVEGELHATGGEADLTGIDRGGSGSTPQTMRGDAITLANTTGAVLEDNDIEHARDGVYMTFASDTVIRHNRVHNSRYAIHAMYADHLTSEDNYFAGNLAGSILMYGGPFELTRNTIIESKSPATGFGIVLKDGAGATITDNVIASNRVGIKVDNGGATGLSSAPASVRANTIGMNQVGIEVMSSARAVFSENSLVENTVQVVVDGKAPDVTWSLDGAGNYWSSYKGYDASGDGIGDVAYIQGGSIANILTKSPVMMSLASGPAFRILQAVEDRWAPEHPVARDDFPLMSRRSPAVDESLRPSSAPGWFGVSGLLLALGSGAALVLARRPRRTLDV